MTDARLYFAVGLPIVAVLASLVVSLVQISGIRDDMREIRRDVSAVHTEINGLGTKVEILTGKVWELMGHK